MSTTPRSQHSSPLSLRNVTVTDQFWHAEQELVRTAVIPFQWAALNDDVPGAAPSYCMHNFKAAAAQNKRGGEQGTGIECPTYTYRGFEIKPEDPEHPDPDKFYGLVFQDTDFSKWIEAVGYSLASHPDAELEATADAAIDVVCAAQLENGYLDTYYILNGMDRAFHNLRCHHELYCLGHLVEGAIAYYEGTGKDKLLKAAARFADYVADYFGPKPDQCKGYPGHEIAEMALVRLADITGNHKYLELAKFFIDERGTEPNYFLLEDERNREDGFGDMVWNFDGAYAQSDRPVREQTEAEGHAVRAGYLYAGMAAVAKKTGDQTLVRACETLWRNIVDKKLYVTGGIGGTKEEESFSYNYDLPNDSAYSETCAAVALVFFARRMLELTPKSEYADVMELSLYNTVLAGMALDGKSFFYVNPLEVNPYACLRDRRLEHVKPVRQKWFGCACCPPNIARLVESVQEYAYTVADDGSTLFTHLYMSGQAEAELNGARFTLDVNANTPWQGDGKITVHVSQPTNATLAFRLPGWAGGETAAGAITSTGETDGDRISRDIRDGYLYVSGEWHDGDVINFDFPMPVRMLSANPLVREDVDKVAFTRGPIVYCAEERDNGSNLHLLHADMQAILSDSSCIRTEMFDFHVGASGIDERGTGEVEATTRRIARMRVPAWRPALPSSAVLDPDQPSSAPLYGEYEPVKHSHTTATLIPYFAWANRGANEMTVFLRI